MKTAGEKFNELEGQDRALAFEKTCSYLMSKLHILVGSRVVALDRQLRMVLETHQMLGAPKKRSEGQEEAPMDMMARWLNGQDVA